MTNWKISDTGCGLVAFMNAVRPFVYFPAFAPPSLSNDVLAVQGGDKS